MKKLLFLLAIPAIAIAWSLPPTSQQGAYLKHQNKIVNPGAENGTAKVLVSAGTLTATTLTAELGLGARSFKWCPAAAGNTLSMSYYVVEGALKGQNGEASMLAQTSGTDFSLRVFDGSNQLATASTLTPSSSYHGWSQNFIFPSAGSLTINAIAGNPANCIFLDDAYLGRPSNIGTVEQAQFVGSAYFASTASCTWTRSSATLGAPGAVAACPGPTIELLSGIGSIQTTDTDLPQVTINSLPPGLYEVNVCAYAASNTGSPDSAIAISDGTTTSGQTGLGNLVTGYLSTCTTGTFSYADSGNRTFTLYVSSNGASQININNTNSNNQRMRWVFRRYPLQSQMLLKADQGDYGWTAYTPTITNFGTVSSQACYHSRINDSLYLRCKFTTSTGGAAAEARIPFPGSLVSSSNISTLETVGDLIMNATSVGVLKALAEPSIGYLTFSRDSATNNLTKINGNTLAASGFSYSVFAGPIPIQGWESNQRAPALINSVVSKYEGATSFESADVTCSSSSAINNNPGSWISSIGNISSGQCAITIANGVFSGAPDCVMTPQSSTAITDAVIYRHNFISATSGTVAAYNVTAAANATTFRVDVLCKGPK